MDFRPAQRLVAGVQKAIASRLRPVLFAAGERIFRAGDAADGCYIIVSGQVQARGRSRQARRHGSGARLCPAGINSRRAGAARRPAALGQRVRRKQGRGRTSAGRRDRGAVRRTAERGSWHLPCARPRRIHQAPPHHRAVAGPRRGRCANPEVDAMVERALTAQRAIERWPEERIDRLLLDVAAAIAANAERLAIETVRERGLATPPTRPRRTPMPAWASAAISPAGVAGALSAPTKGRASPASQARPAWSLPSCR